MGCALDPIFGFQEGAPGELTEIGLGVRRTTKGDYVMDDFEATVVAQDAIRIDLYDDDLDGSTRGRYTKVISLNVARAMAVILINAIERAEVADALASEAYKQRGKK